MVELLKRGRLAATERITFRGAPAVRKTLFMRPRIPGLSADFDRWLASREVRQIRAAEGIEGVPRILAVPAPNVYVREFVDGVALPRAPTPATLRPAPTLATPTIRSSPSPASNGIHRPQSRDDRAARRRALR